MSNKHNGISGESDARTLNVGHGNFVVANRIVAILEMGSLPMKRLREKALEDNTLLDATAGRKTRSLVVLDSKHVILSAMGPATLQERMTGTPAVLNRAQLEWEGGELVS